MFATVHTTEFVKLRRSKVTWATLAGYDLRMCCAPFAGRPCGVGIVYTQSHRVYTSCDKRISGAVSGRSVTVQAGRCARTRFSPRGS